MNTKNTIQHKARPHNQYSIKYLQNCIKKEDTRVHYTVLKQHSHKDSGHPQPPHTNACTGHKNPNRNNHAKPHAVPDTQQRNEPSSHTIATRRLKKNGLISTRIQKKASNTLVGARTTKIKLLRKEVIQPHLPVRLPCYDFVPIADPTFDSSLTSLGHWLRVLPTFMT